jgi:hypothetical protein
MWDRCPLLFTKHGDTMVRPAFEWHHTGSRQQQLLERVENVSITVTGSLALNALLDMQSMKLPSAYNFLVWNVLYFLSFSVVITVLLLNVMLWLC